MPIAKSVLANPVANSKILLRTFQETRFLECLHDEAAEPERVLVGVEVLAEVIDNTKHKLIVQIINKLHGELTEQRACTPHIEQFSSRTSASVTT